MFFFTTDITASLESFCHQEAVRRNAQGYMVMKAPPAASFIVTQSQILLQILVIALDAPSHVRGMDQIV